MFPHCLLIVSHLELFVKRFFWNSLAIPDIFLGGQLLVSWLHHQGLAFVPLLYHTLSGLSRGFFNFFYSFGRWLRRNWLKRWASFHTVTHGGHQFPTSLVTHGFPLDTLIVSQLGRFVKGFFTFFFRLPDFITTLALLEASRLITSPWHYRLYHTCPQIAIGKIHKIGKNNYLLFVQLFAWQIAGGVL